MKKQIVAVIAVLAAALPAVSWAADTEKTMADISAKYGNSMAILTVKIHLETGDNPAGGQAVCIDKAGVFITTILDPSLRDEMVKDIKLVMPGRDGKTYDGKFLGVDPTSGLGFIQAVGVKSGDVTPVEFVEQPDLKIGQQVVSLGVLSGDGNHAITVGSAHISALMRVPGPMVYVTGGKLSGVCAPVFSADGKAVGMVGRQLALVYQTDTPNGPMALPLRGEDETGFFIPSDELFQTVKNIPKPGEQRRMGWIGVSNFLPVTEEKSKIEKIELPAVMCEHIFPGQPADQAKIKDSDYILEVNGKKLEKLANPAFDVQNFTRQLFKFQVGQKVELTIMSQGEKDTHKVTVTVGPMPTLPNEAARFVDKPLGMLVRARVPMDEYLIKGEGAKKDGVVIVGIAKQSAAELYALQPGDIITAVGEQAVKTIDNYKTLSDGIANSFKKNEPVKLTIFRGVQSLTISILPPRQLP